jgi:hypothetical protein
MIKFILFLASLEKKVKEAKAEEVKVIEAEYEDLKKQTEPYRKAMPSIPSFGARAKAAIRNIGNVARNAYGLTIGYARAKGQNWKTRRHYKKNPASKARIRYLKAGFAQNEGAQATYGKQIEKTGDHPYHLKPNHHLPRKENAEKTFEQIHELHKYTKLKNVSDRDDSFDGHSSGADIGIYMAGDERIKKYGIKKVQARAPAPVGIKARRIGQKLLMPFVNEDNVGKTAGKRSALEMAARKPLVPVDVIAGRYDGLVPPSDAVYKHADHHYVIDHPDSTHFGTSGVNKDMNNIFIQNLKEKEKQKKTYKKAA